LLLDQGANPNGKDANGTTVFMHVFQSARYDLQSKIARVLASAGADVHAKDNLGQSAAALAASRGRIEALRVLIELGATVDEKIALEVKLFDSAAKDHAQEVKRLLAKGADPNMKAIKAGSAYRIDPPLNSAARLGHRKIVEILLKAGADPNALDRSNQAPLLSAIREAIPKWFSYC
jgi:ankyrin repeat protein